VILGYVKILFIGKVFVLPDCSQLYIYNW